MWVLGWVLASAGATTLATLAASAATAAVLAEVEHSLSTAVAALAFAVTVLAVHPGHSMLLYLGMGLANYTMIYKALQY